MKEIYDPVEFYRENLDNAVNYEEEYLPEIWRNITKEQLEAGHGGMDYLIFRDFALRLINGDEMPIDVYDAASWMVITALSEKSVKENGAPQEIPDFTRGEWINRKPMDVTTMPD